MAIGFSTTRSMKTPGDSDRSRRRSGQRRPMVVATAAATAAAAIAGGWWVTAAPNNIETSYVPTDGCRVADTREAAPIGEAVGAFGPDEAITVQITGENGECTGDLAVPESAIAVALNVTATNPTATSNIRVYPADLEEPPLLSNLNVSAGAPPTPNKVDAKLSTDGAINVYNEFGEVNVVIDVLGYYLEGGPAGIPGVGGTPAVVVSAGGSAIADPSIGVRFKAVSSGGEVYLGENDLGVSANRVEASTTWPDSLPRPFSFGFADGVITATLAGSDTIAPVDLTRPATCDNPSELQIRLDARADAAETLLRSVRVNGVPIGDIGPTTNNNGDFFDSTEVVSLDGADLSTIEIVGLIETQDWGRGNENNRVQITVGC
ncbi:MAG: hypothetical protein AAF945_09120 [Actinomycetota bacterium]